MQSLDSDSSTPSTMTDVERPTSPLILQEVPPEFNFTRINMEMENNNNFNNSHIPRQRRHEQFVVIIITDHAYADAPPSFPTPTPSPHPAPFPNHEGILYLLYTGAIVVMFPALTQLTQLKFLDNKPSPFETHTFFTITSVVAYIIAIPTSAILFYMRAYINNTTRERFSPAAYYVYMILKTVFCLSAILAPVSLALVLLVPHTLRWIGYTLIIFLVIVIIVACNFNDPAKLLLKKGMSKLGIVR